MRNLNDLIVESSDAERVTQGGVCLSFLNSLHHDCLFILDFPHDPYSDKNPVNSICARGDLLIPSDSRPSGCYDTKVRSKFKLNLGQSSNND